jgi:membrane protein
MSVRRQGLSLGSTSIRLPGVPTRRQAVGLVRALADRGARHGLFVFTSAMAFRALVSLVPLTLLTLGLLGAVGKQKIWNDTVAPAIDDRFTPQVYRAIDSSAEKILTSGTAALIAFASLLLFWNLTATVSIVMAALNRIHDVQERRRLTQRAVTAAGLAVTIGVCVIGAVLVVALVGRIDVGPVGNGVLAVVKWGTAVGLLGLAVGLLVRFAPAERPEARWASAGSVLVVLSWIVFSLVFRWWVTSVANFTTAIGQLTFFLLLTAYVFVSCSIFLVGVELDELVRDKAEQ